MALPSNNKVGSIAWMLLFIQVLVQKHPISYIHTFVLLLMNPYPPSPPPTPNTHSLLQSINQLGMPYWKITRHQSPPWEAFPLHSRDKIIVLSPDATDVLTEFSSDEVRFIINKLHYSFNAYVINTFHNENTLLHPPSTRYMLLEVLSIAPYAKPNPWTTPHYTDYLSKDSPYKNIYPNDNHTSSTLTMW